MKNINVQIGLCDNLARPMTFALKTDEKMSIHNNQKKANKFRKACNNVSVSERPNKI